MTDAESEGAAPISALALASILLGMFGASLPAVVCGHLGLSRIKRSEGRLRGIGIGIVGLVLGYIGLALFAMFLIVLFSGNSLSMGKVRTLHTAYNLKTAVRAYEVEYHRAGIGDKPLARSDHSIMNVLAASESGEEESRLNNRGIVFYADRRAKGGEQSGWKGGMAYNEGEGWALYDYWGNCYFLAFDLDGDGVITIMMGDDVESIVDVPEPVLVWSAGPDGVAGTEDDIKSW